MKCTRSKIRHGPLFRHWFRFCMRREYLEFKINSSHFLSVTYFINSRHLFLFPPNPLSLNPTFVTIKYDLIRLYMFPGLMFILLYQCINSYIIVSLGSHGSRLLYSTYTILYSKKVNKVKSSTTGSLYTDI